MVYYYYYSIIVHGLYIYIYIYIPSGDPSQYPNLMTGETLNKISRAYSHVLIQYSNPKCGFNLPIMSSCHSASLSTKLLLVPCVDRTPYSLDPPHPTPHPPPLIRNMATDLVLSRFLFSLFAKVGGGITKMK